MWVDMTASVLQIPFDIRNKCYVTVVENKKGDAAWPGLMT